VDLFKEYEWRGTIHGATEQIAQVLARDKLVAYAGFDPTAASLHVGSLLPLMQLARLQRFGHTPIALAGGGTGLVGDPSGKSDERRLLTQDQIDENLIGIKRQLAQFLDFEVKTNPARLVNNADWLGTITLTNFLRDVGKSFTVNFMMQKESVKRRITSEEGISYTEFSYMLMQAYDFLVLYETHNCTLQVGGSDQWGNMTLGIDLIRKKHATTAHAIVFPLITNSDGSKFGKTEAGTVWLDANMTSPYRFYQWLLNTDDRDAIDRLNYLTWLSQDEIAALQAELTSAPEKRSAQRALAREVTTIVHGESELRKAEKASQVLFGGEIEGLGKQDVLDIFEDVPTTEIPRSEMAGDGMLAVDLAAASGIVKSKGEAKRMIQAGGVYVNNRRVGGIEECISVSHAIEDEILVLRKGKKQYLVVRLI